MVKPDIYIEGETVYLRSLRMEDVNQNYLSWLQDEEVMMGIATTGYTMDKLKIYVKERLENETTAFFAICDKGTDEHIGNIKLDFYDARSNVSELGLLIGNKQYWGKGIGLEACKLTIGYGFQQMNLRKIYLAVYESNPSAKKIYEKLGFVLEGTLRKHVMVNGNYFDKYLMGLFKNEVK